MELNVGDLVGDEALICQETLMTDYKCCGGGCTLLIMSFAELAGLNESQPDLGLKLYQLCGRAAYLKLQRTIAVHHGAEEFEQCNSAVLREQLLAKLKHWILDVDLFGENTFSHHDVQKLHKITKVMFLTPGEQILRKG
eukprot:1191745-Prorocentrum_minimum.AAC.2